MFSWLRGRSKSKGSRFRVGLALGGGAGHGIAHIGVLQALTEAAIPVDMIAGSSAGAVAAYLYASGIRPDEMLEMARGLRWRALVSFRPGRYGLYRTDKAIRMMAELAGYPDWNDFSIPFYPVSCNLGNGQAECPRFLSPERAVQASIAIPVLFHPVLANNTAYTDGGIVEAVPSRFLHQQGAGFIIAVDILCGNLPSFAGIHSLFSLTGQVKRIIMGQSGRPFRQYEDVYIGPNISDIPLASLRRWRELFELGYDAAWLQIPYIRQKLSGCRKGNHRYKRRGDPR